MLLENIQFAANTHLCLPCFSHLQVEPTQVPVKILLVTTKAPVSAGHEWPNESFQENASPVQPTIPAIKQSPQLAG